MGRGWTGRRTKRAAGLADLRILFAEPGQALVALGPDESSESLHLHGAHGHTELLAPDPGLLEPARTDADIDVVEAGFAGPSPILEEVIVDAAEHKKIETARPPCSIVTQSYAAYLDQYTGVAALDAVGPIASRHINHPDNKRVEAQLLADLRALGYCPWRHDFLHNGVTHSNIVADLPGTGRFRIKPATLDRLRQILAHEGRGRGRAALADELGALVREMQVEGTPAAALRVANDTPETELPEPALRRELERIVALEPWNPWWKLRCPMAGLGAGLVVVGAHLDSTAGFDSGYSPATDPAPGRDDNGSGLAAVLTLAKHFRQFAGKLTHTVRLCWFNAEEAGLVGSKAYAAQLKAQRAPVRAVFCMDMVGYNSDTSPIFELHAGYTDPAIRDLSVPLATQVADRRGRAPGSLLPAQVYSGTGYAGAPDRTVFDGAINRSDHAAFQQRGWGAVLASEDFYANLPTEPAPDGNPNYHRAHRPDRPTPPSPGPSPAPWAAPPPSPPCRRVGWRPGPRRSPGPRSGAAFARCSAIGRRVCDPVGVRCRARPRSRRPRSRRRSPRRRARPRSCRCPRRTTRSSTPTTSPTWWCRCPRRTS